MINIYIWVYVIYIQKFICNLYLGKYYMLSHVQLFANPRTVACQAPLFTGFPKQEYWSG